MAPAHRLFGLRFTLVLAVGMTASPTPAACGANDPERWYTVLLEGVPVGWMHESVTAADPPDPAGGVVTTSRMRVTIHRAGRGVTSSTESRFTETPEGRPLRVECRQQLGADEISQTVTFSDDSITVTRRQHQSESQKTLPLPRVPGTGPTPPSDRGWLTPHRAQRWVARQLSERANEIRYWSLDPLVSLEPVETSMRVRGRETLQVDQRAIETSVCDTTVSNLPTVVTRQHLDRDGRVVRSTLPIYPGAVLSIVQSSRKPSLTHTHGPDLLAMTLIRPDRPIPHPRRLRRAVYEVLFQDGHRPTANPTLLPTCGVQRVEHRGPTGERVLVDLDRPAQTPSDRPTDQHLEATAFLDAQDPLIGRLTDRALAGTPPHATPGERAENLRSFVHRHIENKNLSVGFATAGEVARDGAGDCTEHAVLLAAMLRRAGIPSRTVNGLIYMDRFGDHRDVFGYHMWTQAWSGDPSQPRGRWLNLDATLRTRAFDAAHIVLSTSAMSDQAATGQLMALAPLIGRMKIKIVDLTTDPE